MANSLSLSNFLCFLHPSPPKIPPPTPPSFRDICFSTHKSRLVPLVSQLDVGNGGSHVPALSAEISSVINPCLAHANTLFFKSAYNVQVIVDDNEPEERLLNRFRREVMRAGVIQECKRRKFFENKQDKEKRKTREAAKRNRRRRPMLRTPFPPKEEISAKNKEDDEDNWDMPEGSLPS